MRISDWSSDVCSSDLRDYEALMADPAIDLIYLATPPSAHADLAHRAIGAGKHILVEKPFAIDAAEAAAILDHARARGVHAFEAMHAPHHALFGDVRAIVASGVLGRIRRNDARISTIIAARYEKGRGGKGWVETVRT